MDLEEVAETIKVLMQQEDERLFLAMRRLNVACKIATQAVEAKNWALADVALADLHVGAESVSDNFICYRVDGPGEDAPDDVQKAFAKDIIEKYKEVLAANGEDWWAQNEG